ncbi:MAG: hypothetical protein Q4F53_09930 [Nesterenkonia sp.]|nr:hypothetical protein [Nesterenkonia sp.]
MAGRLRVLEVPQDCDVETFLRADPAARRPSAAHRRTPVLRDDVSAWLGGDHPGVDRLHACVLVDAEGEVRGRFVVHTSSQLQARLRAADEADAGQTSEPDAADLRPTLFFGLLDDLDETECRTVLADVEERARRLGAGEIFGPVLLLPNQVGAAVVEGHREPGFFDAFWNGAALPAVLTARGFEQWYPGSTWEVPVAAVPPDRRRPPSAAEYAAAGVRRRRVTRAGLRGRRGVVEALRRGLNASFSQLPYYTSITRAQMRRQTAGLELLTDPSLVVLLEDPKDPQDPDGHFDVRGSGVPASFALVVPDPVGVFRRTHGRLGPRDLPDLFRWRFGRSSASTPRDAVLIVQGTRPDMQGRGLLSLVSREVFAALHLGGYGTMRVTFIGEDNPASAAVFARAGGRRLHRTAFFRRRADPVSAESGDGASVSTRQASRWVEVAGRAPSAHNTQPWVPHPVTDEVGAVTGIRLAADPERTLPAADPTHRDLYLSLGAWTESLDIAASAEGRGIEVRSVTGGGAEVSVDLGIIRRTRPCAHTVDDVLTRRVHRGRLADPGREASGVLADCADLREIEEPSARSLESTAARHLTGSPALIEELVDWLRLDRGHPDHHRDGLSAECLLLPRGVGVLGRGLRASRGTRLPGGAARILAAVTPRASEAALRRSARRFRDAGGGEGRGVAVVLSAESLEPEALIRAGRRLQHIWLSLHRAGASVRPLSEVIDCPVTEAALREMVSSASGGSPTASHPVAYFRVGHPDDVPIRSARLTPR